MALTSSKELTPNDMSNSNKETDKTIQNLKIELVKKLDGKIKGFTKVMLEKLSAQQLQKLADNQQIIKNTTGTKTRTNLGTEMIRYFDDLEVTELPAKDFLDQVKRLNVENYFDISDEIKIDDNTEIETINSYILLDYLTSNNKKDNAARQSDWVKRAIAYTNSHLIGTSNETSLFNSESSSKYFILEDGVYKLIEKTEENAK